MYTVNTEVKEIFNGRKGKVTSVDQAAGLMWYYVKLNGDTDPEAFLADELIPAGD